MVDQSDLSYEALISQYVSEYDRCILFENVYTEEMIST